MADLVESPLADRHAASDARMAAFAGWDMPISFAGTVAEHTAVRERVGVFDVSHLGTVRVTGPGAFDRLQSTFTNDLHRIGPGRAQAKGSRRADAQGSTPLEQPPARQRLRNDAGTCHV